MTKVFYPLLLFLGMGVACSDSGSPTAPSDPLEEARPQPAPTPDAVARYRVTFAASWSQTTHPDRFPSNPHFSPLIGATHGSETRLWQVGGFASDGIENMAELGRISPLDDIIRAAIDDGRAQHLLSGGGIGRSPGEVSLEFEIRREFPFVTLVSMIAPSPDWFVGISAVNFLEGGDWPNDLVIELFPYDAGTDSGTVYDAPDRDTVPPEPISRITGAPFAAAGTVAPLGVFRFTRTGS